MEFTKDEMAFLDEVLTSEPILGISFNKRDDLVEIARNITAEGMTTITYSILCDMVRKAEKTQHMVEQEINGVNVCAYPVVRF